MAKRDERISLYVTEERKHDLERRAESEDVALSKYLNQLIDRQMQMEAEDEVSAQTRATEQLQRVIDEGQRDLRDVANDVRTLNAKAGVYAIAAFELVKQDHQQAEIRDAISTGSRRLRDDVDPSEAVPDDADGDAGADQSSSDSGGNSDDPFAHRRDQQ